MKRWFTPHPDSVLGQLHSPQFLKWQACISLVMLPVLFQLPWAEHGFAWRWAMPTLLSLLPYLYSYREIFLGPQRWLPWHAGVIAVLGAVLWPMGAAGSMYMLIAAILLAFGPPWRGWLLGLGVIAALAGLEAYWLGKPALAYAFQVLLGGGIGGLGNLLYMRSQRKEAELRLSQDEVRRLATLAERERIGRDLHDLLGHTLSLVTLKSELARKLALADPPRAQREMEEVERVSRHALAEVRAAVTGMRRSDLAAELISARLMLEASGIAFEAELPGAMQLSPEVEAPLALVLREAVTNIHRHARASTARVQVVIEEERLQMQISDNGRGGLAAHGNGVNGMRERVRALGGQLAIDSPARRGTMLDVLVPLRAASRPAAAPMRVPAPALGGQESAA